MNDLNNEKRNRTSTVRLETNVMDEIRKKLEEEKNHLIVNSGYHSENEPTDLQEADYEIFGGGNPIENESDENFFSELENTETYIDEEKDSDEKINTGIIYDLVNEPEKELSRDDENPRMTKTSLQKELLKDKGIYWVNETPLCGFLVTYDDNPNGDFFELRYGRLVITDNGNYNNNCLVIKDKNISPMHAIINFSEKGAFVLDQFSEYGTKIKHKDEEKFIELSGNKEQISDRDVIIFGNVSFKIYLI